MGNDVLLVHVLITPNKSVTAWCQLCFGRKCCVCNELGDGNADKKMSSSPSSLRPHLQE